MLATNYCNDLPYLYYVGPVCVGGIMLLCAMYSGELMSRGAHGTVDFMSSFMRVRDSVGEFFCFFLFY
jgi:hypothetical protein